MKIGIDARLYGTKHRGLGRYVKKLVDGLVSVDQKNQYVIFLTKDNIDEFEPQNNKVKKVLMDARWYSLKEQIIVTKVIKKEQIDLMHFPHFNVPLSYNQRFIVTIHDLIIDNFPDSRATNLPIWQYKIKLSVYKKILRHAVKKAEKIITPSQFVKDDLVGLYQVSPDKIKVIYEGYFLEETQKSSSAFVKKEPLKPFLLYVGAFYPHKNLERLIKVFSRLNKDKKFQLVIAGKKDEFYQRLSKQIKDDDIIFTGFVAESELKDLYQRAVLFVFPSLYEGFGLPTVEAQAHRLPVAASNQSCLPEILEDSVQYFNPEDEEDMFNKISQVLNDQNLQQDLVKRGLENIQRFSWHRMVKETLEIYQK